MAPPRFVVVGHPNKGKSSLVATLAGDADVGIGPQPGTTRRRAGYEMIVGDEVLYELVDTPGFQRARRVLQWLENDASGPEDRAAAVARFVAEHAGHADYVNEVELLTPLVDPDRPAGVLYVVDGSVPYGPDYEPEMEVLRWTGQPSLAIINPIGKADHIRPWRAALGQYFRIVRVLNAVQAPFDQRLELLEAFGQMREAWRAPLRSAVEQLARRRAGQRQQSARLIAEMIAASLHAQATRRFGNPQDAAATQPREALRIALMAELRGLEAKSRRAVEEMYDHAGLERAEAELHDSTVSSDATTDASGGEESGGAWLVKPVRADLFSQEAWLLFGLKPRHLMVAGAAGGAVTGGVIDAHLLGHSFMLGTVLGAASGAAAGWWSAGRIADLPLTTRKVLGGGATLRCGPVTQVNFPFVLLNRAVLHHRVVAQRTHAVRGALQVTLATDQAVAPGTEPEHAGRLNMLDEEQRKAAGKLFQRLRKTRGNAETTSVVLDDLAAVIEPVLREVPGVAEAP